MYVKPIIMFLIAWFAFNSTLAHASDRDEGSFRVTASVPRVCGIDAGAFTIDPATSEIRGTVQEYCNDMSGFHVVASHRSLTSGETATIEYDGVESEINQAGFVPVAYRAGARFRYVPVVIRQQNLENAITVTFSISMM